jgi:hypothetical protein
VNSEVIDADSATLDPGTARPAVGHLLERADAAAGRGDYIAALAWLGRADAKGGGLDPLYEERRVRWRLNAEAVPVGPSQWFG